MDTKICPRPACAFGGSPQPLDHFGKASNTSDHLSVHCKTCRSEYRRIRSERPEAKELARISTAKYRASEHGRKRTRDTYTSPEYRERVNKYVKEYQKRPEVKLFRAMKAATYRTRNALKARARIVCELAMRSGKIIRPDHCEWCKRDAQPSELQAHHWRGYDPAHWLDVKHVHHTCHRKCENVMPEDWA